jgi:hypothetical protein
MRFAVPSLPPPTGDAVLDLLYVAVTVGFFALMIAYVRGCERLGRGEGS